MLPTIITTNDSLVSTQHPHGCDGAHGAWHSRHDSGFNSRTRTGATFLFSPSRFLITRFTTHPHGATKRAWKMRSTNACFNPRTRTGTIYCHYNTLRRRSFNPRTRTGATVKAIAYDTPAETFQPTHPHGVRRLRPVIWCLH